MRTGYYTLLLLSAICIVNSCKEMNMQEPDDGITVISPVRERASKIEVAPKKIFTEDKKKIIDCLVSVPQRVIDTSILTEVEYNQTDMMGYEKLELPTGDRLLIINWGCESYHLTFRFETSRFGTDTSKVKLWYSILTQLLYVIEPAVNAPVKIQQGIDEIRHYLEQDSMPVAYNVSLTLSRDSLLSSDMVFEQVKILGDTSVRLDATFTLNEL